MSIVLPVIGAGGRRSGATPKRARDAHTTTAPAPAGPRRSLIDSHGRTIHDLRLSITDRCNFRCVYCMEPDVRFLPAAELLTVDEMIRLARTCVGLGVTKVRLTGGEPTVHPRLTDIIAGVAASGVADVAMTTNGSLMDDASLLAWRNAGLTRLTISIDSAEEPAFARTTRSNVPLSRVLDGIRAARQVGFASIKLNAVVVRGLNEDQVAPLAGLARRLGVEMRYIEYMPLDSGHHWDKSKLVPADEIISRISAAYPLRRLGREAPSSTAEIYEFADAARDATARIGVIAPVTRSFCGACSRLRITADGKVRPCLFSLEEYDLRPALRSGGGDEAVQQVLADAAWRKQAGHGITAPGFIQPDRPMSAIGG